MPPLLLLVKLSVIFLLIVPDECRQLSDSRMSFKSAEESELLETQAEPQSIESKLLLFLKKQQTPKILESQPPDLPALSKSSELSKLFEPSVPSIYPKGQESSWYLKKLHASTSPLSTSLKSNQISEDKLPSFEFQLSDLIDPIKLELLTAWTDVEASLNTDQSKDNGNLKLCYVKAILCTLRKQLLQLSKSADVDDTNLQKFQAWTHSRSRPSSLEDQPQSSRSRKKKVKIQQRPDQSEKLAANWFGSHTKLLRAKVIKLKVFETKEQASKFKQSLKQKVKRPKKPQKPKRKLTLSEGDNKLSQSWKKHGNLRKSKTMRCYQTRKQENNGTRTVCVTYPASWGEGRNYTITNDAPFPYYYPAYYYPTYYYYPYYGYYYGRRR